MEQRRNGHLWITLQTPGCPSTFKTNCPHVSLTQHLKLSEQRSGMQTLFNKIGKKNEQKNFERTLMFLIKMTRRSQTSVRGSLFFTKLDSKDPSHQMAASCLQLNWSVYYVTENQSANIMSGAASQKFFSRLKLLWSLTVGHSDNTSFDDTSLFIFLFCFNPMINLDI